MKAPENRSSTFTGRVLAVLTESFPDKADPVEKLAGECMRFREVCGDYLACGEAIRRFERVGEAARERVRDYSELKAELEEELRAMIESGLVCRSCGKPHRENSTGG